MLVSVKDNGEIVAIGYVEGFNVIELDDNLLNGINLYENKVAYKEGILTVTKRKEEEILWQTITDLQLELLMTNQALTDAQLEIEMLKGGV